MEQNAFPFPFVIFFSSLLVQKVTFCLAVMYKSSLIIIIIIIITAAAAAAVKTVTGTY
jgi:hypothetical protein